MKRIFLMTIIGMLSIVGCDIEGKYSAINYNAERVVNIDYDDIKKSVDEALGEYKNNGYWD